MLQGSRLPSACHRGQGRRQVELCDFWSDKRRRAWRMIWYPKRSATELSHHSVLSLSHTPSLHPHAVFSVSPPPNGYTSLAAFSPPSVADALGVTPKNLYSDPMPSESTSLRAALAISCFLSNDLAAFSSLSRRGPRPSEMRKSRWEMGPWAVAGAKWVVRIGRHFRSTARSHRSP